MQNEEKIGSLKHISINNIYQEYMDMLYFFLSLRKKGLQVNMIFYKKNPNTAKFINF